MDPVPKTRYSGFGSAIVKLVEGGFSSFFCQIFAIFATVLRNFEKTPNNMPNILQKMKNCPVHLPSSACLEPIFWLIPDTQKSDFWYLPDPSLVFMQHIYQL